MTTYLHRLNMDSVMMATFLFMAVAPISWADNRVEYETEVSTSDKKPERKVVKLKDARLKIEVNATDADAGIQVFIDADPWKWMDIYDPKGKMIFRSYTRGRFAKQGGTELFMESAEPNFNDLTLEKFLQRFPEGIYRIRGKGMEGETLIGSAKLTHNLPAGPELVSPLKGQGLVDPGNAVVMWQPVGAPNGSPIIGYQVLVVQIQSKFTAIPKVVLDVMMPATATSM